MSADTVSGLIFLTGVTFALGLGFGSWLFFNKRRKDDDE
jgi:hypothetical protein